MRRTSLVNILVFVAGLGIGFFSRSAYTNMLQRRTHAADLAAIEKLHQEDIKATLTQDPKGLVNIWADDAVRINPGSPPEVGKEAIGVANEKVHIQYADFKVLSYSAEYKNLQIEDGLACEWGEHKGVYKLSPDAAQASFDATGIHVLKRQNDGSWKFALIILQP
jgi:uncharacterized protein (TIGR02246 family)